MAFAAGSRCRVNLVSAGVSQGVLQPQPPVIGVVTDVTGTTITADMGPGNTLVEDAANLDEISDASPDERDAFIDKVVTGWITVPNPPIPGKPYTDPYTGRVVDIYVVNQSSTMVLIK